MLDTAKARMLPAGSRKCFESPTYRSLTSIARQEPGWGHLTYWMEEVMGPGGRMPQHAEDHGFLMLLPLVGSVRVIDTEHMPWQVAAGQVLVLPFEAGQEYQLENPEQDERVSFIRIGWRTNEPVNDVPVLTRFDLDGSANQLMTLSGPPFTLQLGKFDGRAEAVIHFMNDREKKLVFVIEGAFEVSHRLLENRDGMLLWNVAMAELEALSNGAILLVMTTEAG